MVDAPTGRVPDQARLRRAATEMEKSRRRAALTGLRRAGSLPSKRSRIAVSRASAGRLQRDRRNAQQLLKIVNSFCGSNSKDRKCCAGGDEGNRGQSTILAKALKTTRAAAGPCVVASADGRANAAPHFGASPARPAWRSARCPRSTRCPTRCWSRRSARRRNRFRARRETARGYALTWLRAAAERPVNKVIADQWGNLSIGVRTETPCARSAQYSTRPVASRFSAANFWP
jgi:hypothetical protein